VDQSSGRNPGRAKGRSNCLLGLGLAAATLIGCGSRPAATAAPQETVTVTTPRDRTPTLTSVSPHAGAAPATPEEIDQFFAHPEQGDAAVTTTTTAASPREPVRLGAVSVTGSRTVELVQARLKDEMVQVKRCAELDRLHRPRGILRVELTVNASGRVTSVKKTDPSSVRDERVTACVLGVFAHAKFPKAVGTDADITYPVYFAY
jgi:hypothetical protein